MDFLKKKQSTEDPQKVIQACLRSRDFDGAITAFKTLLAKSPNSTQMRMRYGDTLVLARRKNDAIAQYRQVAEEMATSGYLVKAIATYKKIVKLDPSQADIIETVARLNAERSGEASASSSGGGMNSSASTVEMSSAPAFNDMGMEESDGSVEDLGEEIQLGAMPGMDSAAETAPEPVPAPAPVADDFAVGGDLDGLADLAADDLGADDLGADDLGADDLGADDLGADDLGADDLSADELATDDLAADEESAPEAESSIASEVDTGGGLGFSFDAPEPEPAATEEPAAEAAGGFSFDAPEPAPVAADPVETDANPLGESDESKPGDEDFEGDLLGLLGDEFDSMLDNILCDVDSDDAMGPLQVAPAETNIRLFAHLSIDEFVEVLKLLERKTVKADEVIVAEGDEGNSMFIISEGEFDASTAKNGDSVKVATLGEGDFFGEMAILASTPRTATVKATKNGELLILERTHLEQIFHQYPEIEAKIRLASDERGEQLRTLE